MEEQVKLSESQMRMNALDNAVRHRLKEETPEQVVQAAQKYFEFLQGQQKK